ncbi:MAG: hypothetical protein LBL58_15525 [Tannerellaceae bacterium]|jgi:hypothetical protein|nr:hypothetical protein [Tannerellaceae bacterium]
MEAKKVVLSVFIAALLPIGDIHAQESGKVEATLSGDLVSSYVWRGFKQAGASVQPSLSVGYKGWSLSGWASTDIGGNDHKEVDFSLGYSLGGLNIALTDYWWDGEDANRYFSCPADGNTGHLFEAGVSYALPGSFPLSLSWNTFLLGEGNKKADGNNSFSTYVEVAYPFKIKEVDFTISAGFLPWESAVYGPEMDGFKFTSIQIGASREMEINERFSLPIFASIIANPAVEDIHFVLGITLK